LPVFANNFGYVVNADIFDFDFVAFFANFEHFEYYGLDEFDEFVNKQKQLRIKKTNFEIKENHLYDLQWNNIKV
jgi:hypothetical protein